MNEQPCDTIEQSIELLISTFPQEQHGETDTIMRALLIATEGFTAGTVAETVRALLRYQVLDHDPHYMPTAPELAMYLRDVEAGTGFDFYSAAEHQEQAPAAPSEPVGMPLRASRPMPRAGGVVLSMRPRQSETELLAANRKPRSRRRRTGCGMTRRPYYNAVNAENGLSTTEHGWVIVDGRGRVWCQMFFPSEEAADTTMIRCGLLDRDYVAKPARYVHWHTTDVRAKQIYGSKRDTILVDDIPQKGASA